MNHKEILIVKFRVYEYWIVNFDLNYTRVGKLGSTELFSDS